MKFENTQVWGFQSALRGMRNPKNSWKNSDSHFGIVEYEQYLSSPPKDKPSHGIPCHFMNHNGKYIEYAAIGENDMRLAQTLIRSGSEHRKFLRQIFVSVDITAPLYWWKEFDTYKVGTVANSTSTMHKIASNEITKDCFEIDDYTDDLNLIDDVPLCIRVDSFIDDLEQLRQLHLHYLKMSKDNESTEEQRKQYAIEAKRYWKELIRWLPESWLQMRTVTLNYENLLAICSKGQRRFHKLNEWSGKEDSELNNFISWARELPFAQEFIFIDEVSEEVK